MEPTLTLDQVLQLRPKTNEIARFLQTMLTRHLETLRPLLDPAGVLGKIANSGRTSWMEKSKGEFRALYEKYGRPFRFAEDFDSDTLNETDAKIDVRPWEYVHEARTERETERVKITSPTRWILSYAGDLSLERMKEAMAVREPIQSPLQHRFVVLALLFHLVIQKSPRVTEMLKSLRYHLESVPCEELHGLPLITVRFALPSFRPDDTLILKATSLSGLPAFIELIDVEAVREMKDPLKEELEKLVK